MKEINNFKINNLMYKFSRTVATFMLTIAASQLYAQKWVDAPAYSKKNAANVLQRSNFFVPLFGVTYKEEFEVLLDKMPPNSLRGIVIYNHGCGGQWGWENNTV